MGACTLSPGNYCARLMNSIIIGLGVSMSLAPFVCRERDGIALGGKRRREKEGWKEGRGKKGTEREREKWGGGTRGVRGKEEKEEEEDKER